MKRLIRATLVVLLAGFLLLVMAGLSNEVKVRNLKENGITVRGAVMDGGPLAEPEGRMTHYLKVAFEREDLGRMVRDFPVDSDDYTRAMEAGAIPITHVPGRPDLQVVGSHYGYDRKPLYAALLGFFFSALGLILTGFTAGKPSPA